MCYKIDGRGGERDSVEAVGEAVVGEDPAVLGEAVVREVDAEERVHTA
jgi:hypothetical protein